MVSHLRKSKWLYCSHHIVNACSCVKCHTSSGRGKPFRQVKLFKKNKKTFVTALAEKKKLKNFFLLICRNFLATINKSNVSLIAMQHCFAIGYVQGDVGCFLTLHVKETWDSQVCGAMTNVGQLSFTFQSNLLCYSFTYWEKYICI